jgi:transposase
VGQVALYSGVERRRRWDADTRLKILSEAFARGANIAQVARRHDISTGQIYTWRRKWRLRSQKLRNWLISALRKRCWLRGRREPSDTTPAIVIDLARGRRVTIFASASAAGDQQG